MTTRKLTANERTHGARAYSHNASRRAHQLSGPRRERVVCGPEGDAVLNRAPRFDGDTVCDCGFRICAQRGPCAPVVAAPHSTAPSKCRACGERLAKISHECASCAVGRLLDDAPVVAAPKPSPAPVVERPRFKVGDRVRCINSSLLMIGETYTISRVGGAQQAGETQGNVQVEGVTEWFLPSRFEPVEPLTSERGEWTPEACGWKRLPDNDSGGIEYAYGKTGHGSWDRVVTATARNARTFTAHTNGCDMISGGPWPLAQACAAALGIELRDCAGTCRAFNGSSQLGDTWVGGDRVESCARAAVEAWSAMQREGS